MTDTERRPVVGGGQLKGPGAKAGLGPRLAGGARPEGGIRATIRAEPRRQEENPSQPPRLAARIGADWPFT